MSAVYGGPRVSECRQSPHGRPLALANVASTFRHCAGDDADDVRWTMRRTLREGRHSLKHSSVRG